VGGAGVTSTTSTAPSQTVPPTTTQQTTTAPTTTQSGGGGGGNAALVAQGKTLFTSLGCAGCHSIDGTKLVGPTFKGLAGSKVTLTDGSTVTADDAYLLESIFDPDKTIVQGYTPGVMSGVIKPGSVSQADAKALVAYIDSLK
jgi:cytochrome c oxidase subunit 2